MSEGTGLLGIVIALAICFLIVLLQILATILGYIDEAAAF